jgi:hypothetical protein
MEKDRAHPTQRLTAELLILLAGTLLGTAGTLLLRNNADVAPLLFSWLVLLCLFVIYHGWRHNDSYKHDPALSGLFAFAGIQLMLGTTVLGAGLLSLFTFYDLKRSPTPAFLFTSLMCSVLLVWMSIHPGGALHRLFQSAAARGAVAAALFLLGFAVLWVVNRVI